MAYPAILRDLAQMSCRPSGLPDTADLKVRTTPEYGRPAGQHYT
jgi:hypothetical protein